MVDNSVIPGQNWALERGNTIGPYNTKIDGTTITNVDGLLTAIGAGFYTLPAATNSVLGGVIVPSAQGLLLLDGSGGLTFDQSPTFTGALQAAGLTSTGATTLTGAKIETTVVVTSGASYTVLSSDIHLIIKKGTGSATGVTLPSSPATGRMLVVKDGKADAATNNITITPAAGNIDGAATLVLNTNSASVVLLYNGSEWSIIAVK